MHLNQGTRKARKNHRCELCGLNILAGTKYEFHSWVDSGSVYEMKYHQICLGKISHWKNDDWVDWDFDYEWFRSEYSITQELIDGGTWVPREALDFQQLERKKHERN